MARATSLLLIILFLVCGLLAYLFYNVSSENNKLLAKTEELQVSGPRSISN